MQISYHSILTKIQKLQNLKKYIYKNKNNNLYRPVLLEISRYGRYFFRYETGGLYVPIYLPVQYIPAVPAGTVRH